MIDDLDTKKVNADIPLPVLQRIEEAWMLLDSVIGSDTLATTLESLGATPQACAFHLARHAIESAPGLLERVSCPSVSEGGAS